MKFRSPRESSETGAKRCRFELDTAEPVDRCQGEMLSIAWLTTLLRSARSMRSTWTIPLNRRHLYVELPIIAFFLPFHSSSPRAAAAVRCGDDEGAFANSGGPTLFDDSVGKRNRKFSLSDCCG